MTKHWAIIGRYSKLDIVHNTNLSFNSWTVRFELRNTVVNCDHTYKFLSPLGAKHSLYTWRNLVFWSMYKWEIHSNDLTITLT